LTPLRPEWWLAYVGGDYRWRGRDPGRGRAGVDCWGLYAHVLPHDFGRPVDDFGWAYPSGGAAGLFEARDRISIELPAWRPVEWEEGAGVLFEVKSCPVHIGIATHTPGVVLHAHSSVGVDLLDVPHSVKWKDRFVGCFLPPEAG
jgi:hypothetical protein